MTGDMTTISERNAEVPGLITEGVIPLSRREVFWQARYLQDSPALVHLPFLFWLVSDLRPRRSATLNMGDGVMHFALCQAVDKSSLESLCQGFGRWQGEVPETVARHNAAHYAEFSKLSAADVSQALRQMRRREIDLILVESPLDAATVDALAEGWLPRLSAKGVVIIDGAGEGDEATAEALERLQDAHPHIYFDEGAGLLVLLPGEAPQERLLRLASIEQDSVEEMVVHRVFARLGQLHLKEWAVRDLQGRIERFEGPANLSAPMPAAASGDSVSLAEVEALRNEHVEALQLLTRTLEETEERAIAQAEALKTAQFETSTARKDADRFAATVSAQAAEIEALQRQLAERDERIANLEGSRTAGKRRLRENERELAQLRARYDALAADREALLNSREALLGSTSWKLTAPLRQIRGGGRKS